MASPQRNPAWLMVRAAPDERISLAAEGALLSIMKYCARMGNDGQLPKDEFDVAIMRKAGSKPRERQLLAELLKLERLTETADHYVVDWVDQPKAEDWNDPVKRARWSRGKRLERDGATREFVKARDRNLCRYCGIEVNWLHRQGRFSATYDHIDPDAIDNDRDGIVVACRPCNSRKQDRTPAQARMPLLPIGTDHARAALLLPSLRASLTPARGLSGGLAHGQTGEQPEGGDPSRTHARYGQSRPGTSPPDSPPTDQENAR